jgi:hypothetical protein
MSWNGLWGVVGKLYLGDPCPFKGADSELWTISAFSLSRVLEHGEVAHSSVLAKIVY